MDSKTLISIISANIGREPEEVEFLVRSLGEVIAESVRDGDSVAIPTFGSFEQKKRLERVTLHPSTGRRILVPPKLSVVFKPSALLKQKIRNAGESGD